MRRRRLGDPAGIATALTNLGILAIDRDRFDEAIAYLEEALALDRAVGSTAGPAYSASALGVALLRSGRTDEADALLRTALVAFADLGDDDGVAEMLEAIAESGALDAPGRSLRLLLAARELRARERRRPPAGRRGPDRDPPRGRVRRPVPEEPEAARPTRLRWTRRSGRVRDSRTPPVTRT